MNFIWKVTQKVHIWNEEHPELASDLIFHIQLLEGQPIGHGAFWPAAQPTQDNEGFTAVFSPFTALLLAHEWPHISPLPLPALPQQRM